MSSARPSSDCRVAIVGGGIGGLALACALEQRGIGYRLFERSARLGEIGAGVQMTPNAVKVIRALGLLDGLKQVGFLPDSLIGRNWRSGKTLFRTPLRNACEQLYGASFFHVHRADLHELLLSGVQQERITLGKACQSVEQRADGGVIHFTDGDSFRADLVVGADGIHSAVRNSLFGAQQARFTGHMCWRAVVPFDVMPDFVSPDSSFWMGPKGHVVTYYVKGGKAVNIVAVLESRDWVEESWNLPSSRDELLAAFHGWHPNIQKLFQRVDTTFKWGLFDRDPMDRWSVGNVTLLGDAAHPMLPFLSQGAAMAIEDGYELARALAAPVPVSDALQVYEASRRPRTRQVQLESRERGRTYHLASPLEQIMRDVSYKVRNFINPHKGGIKANWVYEYDATAVPAATASAA
ncbi:FAD-dependent monooxygenase [Komagataeibacter sp. FNDCF1]|uniref:FAD-dependent monooxygenase n=1 Tax=Komagataeibacter sp. FNDCF1 TaxID=2878681 RepID=UPI001E5B4ABB|nr:FAD-dependent monooxygenase [Komagataeibacter sp. FNDCF1]MCE2565209.1 FAD-dependent monooxygenase [Komagataeibacter sp. FNDCF1]